MKLIEDALIEYYGERCHDFAEGCPCCEAWAEFDALIARVNELKAEKVLSDRLARALEYIDDYSLSYPDLGTISAVTKPALEAHAEDRAALEIKL